MPQEANQETSTVDYTKLFDEALALQQQQSWDPALSAYQTLLNQHLNQQPNELSVFRASVVYHNMSTIAQQKGDLLKAYVWSKKSLTLNPDNQLAREAFEHYSKNFEVPVIPHQITNFDNFKSLISKGSPDAWLTLSFVLILTSIWLVLKNIIASKKKQLANDFSIVPKWPAYLLVSVTLLMLAITYIRYQDSTVLRGIIIASSAQIQTAPGENKSVIFEAQSGLELEVLKLSEGYYQVRYPGAFTGWVSNSQLEILGLNFGQNE